MTDLKAMKKELTAVRKSWKALKKEMTAQATTAGVLKQQRRIINIFSDTVNEYEDLHQMFFVTFANISDKNQATDKQYITLFNNLLTPYYLYRRLEELLHMDVIGVELNTGVSHAEERAKLVAKIKAL